MKDISLNTNEYLPLREVVFNTLREAILTGELEPGGRTGSNDAEKKCRGGKDYERGSC